MAYDTFGLGLQAVFSGVAAPGTYINARKAGEDPARALIGTAFDTASTTLMNPATLAVYTMGRIVFSGAHSALNRVSQHIHQVNTPFSQRFEHNAMTARLQAFGLSQMGAGGAGFEAAAQFGRYGR